MKKTFLAAAALFLLVAGISFYRNQPSVVPDTRLTSATPQPENAVPSVTKAVEHVVEPLVEQTTKPRPVEQATPLTTAPRQAKLKTEPRTLHSIFAAMKTGDTDYARALKNYLVNANQAETPEALVAHANELMEIRKRLAEMPDEAARVASDFLENTRNDPRFASERTMTMGLAGDLPAGNRPDLSAGISADIHSALERGAWDQAYYENAVRAYLKNTVGDPATKRAQLEAGVSNLPDSQNRRQLFEAFDELSKAFP